MNIFIYLCAKTIGKKMNKKKQHIRESLPYKPQGIEYLGRYVFLICTYGDAISD